MSLKKSSFLLLFLQTLKTFLTQFPTQFISTCHFRNLYLWRCLEITFHKQKTCLIRCFTREIISVSVNSVRVGRQCSALSLGPCFWPLQHVLQWETKFMSRGKRGNTFWTCKKTVPPLVGFPNRNTPHSRNSTVKGKVERTQNHQWLQASRARATLVVKAWCSFRVAFGRRDTR